MAKKPHDYNPRVVNRRARHDYHILESLEVGIALQGSEVKSIRHGQVTLAEGFARIEPATEELILYNVDVAGYTQAYGANGHEPRRPRKLLAHRRQIKRLATMVDSKGITLIPLTLYFVRGMVKIELGVARGKREHDKREDIKSRESQQEIRRAMSKLRR